MSRGSLTNHTAGGQRFMAGKKCSNTYAVGKGIGLTKNGMGAKSGKTRHEGTRKKRIVPSAKRKAFFSLCAMRLAV